MDRLSCRLARDVPECYVHGADRAIGRSPVLLPHRLVQPLALHRVLAEHDGLEVLDQRLPVEVRPSHRGAEKGVALDALVGGERQEPELARAAELSRMPAVPRCGNTIPGEQRQGDVGDLHGAVLLGPQTLRLKRTSVQPGRLTPRRTRRSTRRRSRDTAPEARRRSPPY